MNICLPDMGERPSQYTKPKPLWSHKMPCSAERKTEGPFQDKRLQGNNGVLPGRLIYPLSLENDLSSLSKTGWLVLQVAEGSRRESKATVWCI